MSLMGEQLAEEWLNRQGYFTIHGVKIGTGEIDLLAVRSVDAKAARIEVSMSSMDQDDISVNLQAQRLESLRSY